MEKTLKLVEDESMYNSEKPIPWSKLLLIQKYLPNFDYLVWIDADIYIMNKDIKLETLIEKYKDFDIICGSDWKMANTGVLIVKNTDFSKVFLQKVYDNEYDPKSDPNDRYLNWEQGSFIHLIDKNYLDCTKKIKVTVPTEINSYWFNYFPGHFVLHFAGVRGELLGYLMRDYCPDRIPDDTDKTYNERMEWLSGPVREHLDEKLRSEKDNERKWILEHKIEYVSTKEYIDLLDKYNFLFDALLNIAKSTGEELEGNCFFHHKSSKRVPDNKAINLYSAAKVSKNILEVGFNAGHSSLLFLLANPENTIDCFDICSNKYTKLCFNYLSLTFPGRIRLHEGDSKSTIPKFREANPGKIYDLIHIDGSHELHDANCDFYNTLSMTKKNSLIVFDDISLPQMKYIWDGYVRDNHVKEIYSLIIEHDPHVVGCYVKDQ